MNTAKLQVKKFAANRGLELNNWGDDGYWMTEGSTIVYVTFPKIGSDEETEMVSFMSVVARNVRVDNTLMSKLLKLNAKMNFGAFALEDDMVIYQYNLLGGDHIDEEEFFNALIMVAIVSDDYDDKIISTHGGVTAVDYIRNALREQDGYVPSW